MFKSLDKMVKIHNNVLCTIDPFAYTYFVENNESVDTIDNTPPALSVSIFFIFFFKNVFIILYVDYSLC